MHKNNNVDENQAYGSFIADKFKPIPEKSPKMNAAEIKAVKAPELPKTITAPKA
jgi:hypothetical protein